jgi:heme/copper-type cytochrome/quinol oxidase subunit 4
VQSKGQKEAADLSCVCWNTSTGINLTTLLLQTLLSVLCTAAPVSYYYTTTATTAAAIAIVAVAVVLQLVHQVVLVHTQTLSVLQQTGLSYYCYYY